MSGHPLRAEPLACLWARLKVALLSFSQARKKDNMSKEMKDRLMKEYVGLGGAENKVSLQRALESTGVF